MGSNEVAAAPPEGWQWLTKKEAAEYVGVPLGWIDAKTAEGILPHYKFGHYVRYLRDDLDALIVRSRRVGR